MGSLQNLVTYDRLAWDRPIKEITITGWDIKKKNKIFATRVIKSVGTPLFKGITSINLGDEPRIISWKLATWVIGSK